MRRREFVTLITGAVIGGPFGARAQQPGMEVIGFLGGQSFDPHLMTAYRGGLKETGHRRQDSGDLFPLRGWSD